MVHVPYKGASLVITDVIAGHDPVDLCYCLVRWHTCAAES
jgi:hypothetical protein